MVARNDEYLDGTKAMLRRHGAEFLRHRFAGKPPLLEIQVTKRCNARCAWCEAWRAPGDGKELADYAAIVRRVDPLTVAFVGGEPLVRPDLDRLIASVRLSTQAASIVLATNGVDLTTERARTLRQAGTDKLVLLLEGMEEAHDRARRSPGLFRRIVGMLPDLGAVGFRSVQIQATISPRISDDLVPLARLAIDHGVRIAYTLEGPNRGGSRGSLPDPRELGRFEEAIERVIELGERNDAVVSSPGYLRGLVPFLGGDGAHLPGCMAGSAFARVSPDGWIQPCGFQPPLGHWTAFPFGTGPVNCVACWTRSRGENSGRIGAGHLVEMYRAQTHDAV